MNKIIKHHIDMHRGIAEADLKAMNDVARELADKVAAVDLDSEMAPFEMLGICRQYAKELEALKELRRERLDIVDALEELLEY